MGLFGFIKKGCLTINKSRLWDLNHNGVFVRYFYFWTKQGFKYGVNGNLRNQLHCCQQLPRHWRPRYTPFHLGKGNYGVVYKCVHQQTGNKVAVKQSPFNPECEGIPATALREISLLKELQHENIVRLIFLKTDLKKFNLRCLEYSWSLIWLKWIFETFWILLGTIQSRHFKSNHSSINSSKPSKLVTAEGSYTVISSPETS